MIQKASLKDTIAVAELAVKMWGGHSAAELAEEFRETIANDDAEIFVSKANGKVIGFAQCGLRHDYVEGTQTSPVGYLEGVYVEAEFRGKGYAGELVRACERWAKEKGCTEFASDCEITNDASLHFHLKCGFEEANRIICFTKKL